MIPHVVGYYAAVLAVMFVGLSARVIRGRRSAKVALGMGGDAGLERRIRVHANFAEYVPFALVLLALAEARGASVPILHGLCLLLVVARGAHAWGVSQSPENFRFRVAGMMMTFGTILGTAILLVVG